jgi:predicted RNA-binding protein YlxR (DUF448 family)
MASRRGQKPQRKLPQRTCVVCRVEMPKRALMRIVRTPEGAVRVDPRGKLSGRGAYLCPREQCFRSRKAREKVAQALGIQIEEQTWERLQPELEELAALRAAELEQGGSGVPAQQFGGEDAEGG